MKHEVNITKEEHHWTSEEKIKWLGYGEWVEEIDKAKIEYLGYPAIIFRIIKREPFSKDEAYFGGYLCGYIRIPKEHPYFRKEDISLKCHGGITFNESHEEHWIGFDCGHFGDLVPTMELFKNNLSSIKKVSQDFLSEETKAFLWSRPVYRNMQFCIDQCKEIINQLINLSLNKTATIKESNKQKHG